MSEKHLTDQRFADLPLSESLQRGLDEAGFEFCTPIQAQSLPAALEGHDVAGQAQTGTGKTIAFLLACCNLLLQKEPLPGYEKGQPRALILAPTRELAIQIHKDALLLNKYTELSIGLVYGGTGYDQQKTMLTGPNDILIGTPGRLIDFFKQNLFTLKHAQVAVMDEADRMFDLGFIKDIRYLLRKMPPPEQRLNLLYSATLSFRVMELAYEHMNDPQEIKVETDEVVADKVEEYSFYPADEEKLPLLVNMIRKDDSERVLVFVNTRHAAEQVARTLDLNGISTAMLSGDVPQTKRERLLDQFKEGKRRVLVATDVAARGLHIPAVSHVYNFDLPQDAEDYVHRIGRTARAGASGEAISFICEKYAYSILDIEEYIGHPLPRRDIEPDLLTAVEIAPKRSWKDKGKDGKKGGGRKPERARSSRERAGHDRPGHDRPGQDRQGRKKSTGSDHSLPQQQQPDQLEKKPGEPRQTTTPSEQPAVSATVETGSERPMDHLASSVEQSQVAHLTKVGSDASDQPPASTETSAPTQSDSQSESKPATPRARPSGKVTRFSRKFGEIPLVG